MERGYIKLYRCILDNPLWKFDQVTKLQAWLDLLLNTNWKPGKLVINSCIINIDRGQIGWSEVTMSKRWSWSRNKVRRFLRMLEDEGNIVQQKNNKTTIITICEYDSYATDDEYNKTKGGDA